MRATFLVALVDALGIGTGLAIMSVPLALPLASLVFLGAFIPLVGAVVSGFLAVIVALLAKGFVYALITLGLLVAVNQLEAHILQPLVMGRAVSIHPLGGGGGDLDRRRARRHRRCAVVGPDRRVLEQRVPGAAGRGPGGSAAEKPRTTTRRSCRPIPTGWSPKANSARRIRG